MSGSALAAASWMSGANVSSSWINRARAARSPSLSAVAVIAIRQRLMTSRMRWGIVDLIISGISRWMFLGIIAGRWNWVYGKPLDPDPRVN